jgi:hypothetical protein
MIEEICAVSRLDQGRVLSGNEARDNHHSPWYLS